jgi:hypothetical protein
LLWHESSSRSPMRSSKPMRRSRTITSPGLDKATQSPGVAIAMRAERAQAGIQTSVNRKRRRPLARSHISRSHPLAWIPAGLPFRSAQGRGDDGRLREIAECGSREYIERGQALQNVPHPQNRLRRARPRFTSAFQQHPPLSQHFSNPPRLASHFPWSTDCQ